MDAIMVIVDRFTKMIWLKTTMMNISLEGIAKIYRNEVWKLHKENSQWQRTTICIEVYREIHKSTRNHQTIVNGVSSSDR